MCSPPSAHSQLAAASSRAPSTEWDRIGHVWEGMNDYPMGSFRRHGLFYLPPSHLLTSDDAAAAAATIKSEFWNSDCIPQTTSSSSLPATNTPRPRPTLTSPNVYSNISTSPATLQSRKEKPQPSRTSFSWIKDNLLQVPIKKEL